MEKEIWKPIENYPDYIVSNQGNVKSLKNNQERLMKGSRDKDGYYFIGLYNNGIRKFYAIHKLVAEAFLPNTENKPCIDHINTDKNDNRVENLRWCTQKENLNNPLSFKKRFRPVLQFDTEGNFINKWESIKDAQVGLNIISKNISCCCKQKVKLVGGYIWRYYDLELYLESKLFKAFNIKNKLVA